MKVLTYLKNTLLAGFAIALTVSCERDISDEAIEATFPNTPDIFIDAPVSLTDEFFISFDPAVGANTEGFGTDENEAYAGSSSIRIDVPAPNDPDGNFIGGIFRDRGEGRDLTGYDALTFWAKGSLTGTIQVGFGTDFLTDTYPVSTAIQLSSGWRKYVIPIPDPSRLVQERGMFLFSAGSFDALGNDNPADANSFSDNIGYTFWLDELKFENLGTTNLLYPFILNGQDVEIDNFTGYTQTIDGLGATFNLGNGQNISVEASRAYFDFTSSDNSVATVSATGDVNLIGAGTATITGSIGNATANGSLTLNSTGSFVNAPDPTQAQADVISIYSESYPSVTGFNPGVFAGSNTQSISVQTFEGNSHVNYEGIDFIGIGWDGTVNVTGETMVHVDIQLTSGAGSALVMELIDFGPDDTDNGFGDGTAGGFNVSSQLMEGQWVGIDIPLSAFTLPTGGGGAGNPNLANIGYIVFVSSNGASFLVDNIYFY
ncbi:Ig-like domain-containing protein [uncultured Kordia sp.]|uniref:Ig-like domain-containing protein n=1 Tax=uncultured Kordia sp. TaxID=507699 RepID=UPI0026051A56|nr:Ig-like domain-containing protein [uncultured Kordia sp.]